MTCLDIWMLEMCVCARVFVCSVHLCAQLYSIPENVSTSKRQNVFQYVPKVVLRDKKNNENSFRCSQTQRCISMHNWFDQIKNSFVPNFYVLFELQNVCSISIRSMEFLIEFYRSFLWLKNQSPNTALEHFIDHSEMREKWFSLKIIASEFDLQFNWNLNVISFFL